MNSKLTRILGIVAGILILSYIGLQIYNSTYKEVITETAISISTMSNISVDGYIIRNEQLISSNKEGVKVFSVQNGSRVPKDGIVANVYSSEESASAVENIEIINEKIAALAETQNQNKIFAADLDILGRQIDERFISILNCVDEDNFIGVDASKTELLNLINLKQITVGTVKDFNTQISLLKQEKDNLSKLVSTPSYIKSSKAGYFISTVDGFENSIDYDKVLDLLPDNLKKITPKAVETNVIGKIVSDYQWYIACVLKVSDAINLSLNQKISLKIPLASVNELPVTIVAMNKDTRTHEVAVIFKSEYMNEDLSSIRKYLVQIGQKNITGIRVNANAVRFVNGKKGVYVKTGNIAKFREINVLFTGRGYLVCEESTNAKGIKLYDEVIVEGKNLYDGKIIA